MASNPPSNIKVSSSSSSVVVPVVTPATESPQNPVPVAPSSGIEGTIDDENDLEGENEVDYDEGENPEPEPAPGAPKKPLTPEEKYKQEVRKTWKNMTDVQLRETMANPVGAAELCREVSRMSDDQLQVIAPHMTDEQISSAIPSMQLQQQGACVQAFSSHQIRQCVKVIPGGDRQLLLQNITLITSAESDPSKNEEIQSIIGFIDPLAMAVAVERPELVDKVIQASCIMTPEQIRVMVPLLTVPQLKSLIETIVSDEGHSMALQMISTEQRTELVSECKAELADLEAALRKTVQLEVTNIADRIAESSRLVQGFCNKPLTSLAEQEHTGLATRLTTAKLKLEKQHREIRKLMTRTKLPLKILSEGESEGPIRKSFLQLEEEMTRLGKTISQQYTILDGTSDSVGLIHKLYDTWTKFQSEQGNALAKSAELITTQEEQMYLDTDLSVVLYDAVQAIGNPATIGDIYCISWNDIIDSGFKSAADFAANNIANLKDLETYILNKKSKGSKQSQTAATSASPVEPEPVPAGAAASH